MRHIESRQNQEVKEVYALRHAKERNQQQLFIAEGLRACITLIQANTKLRALYTTSKNLDQISAYVDEKNICAVSTPVMEKISQASTPSGILGIFEMPPQPKLTSLTAGIVLVNMNDPGNMGTLIRTAAAMNAQSVVLIEGADPWSFKVVQATAGYITHVNLFRCDWIELIQNTPKNNLSLAALVISEGTSPFTLTKEKTLLVIGSEAHGIPKEWLSACNEQITLSMPGNIESLNAAVAGSIALYIIFGKKK